MLRCAKCGKWNTLMVGQCRHCASSLKPREPQRLKPTIERLSPDELVGVLCDPGRGSFRWLVAKKLLAVAQLSHLRAILAAAAAGNFSDLDLQEVVRPVIRSVVESTANRDAVATLLTARGTSVFHVDIATYLCERNDDRGWRYLMAALESRDAAATVRELAAQAIEQRGERDAVPVLFEALRTEPEDSVRTALSYALYRLVKKGRQPDLLLRLLAVTSEVLHRQSLAVDLAQQGVAAGVDVLVAMLADDDLGTKKLAFDGLWRIGWQPTNDRERALVELACEIQICACCHRAFVGPDHEGWNGSRVCSEWCSHSQMDKAAESAEEAYNNKCW